MILGIDASILIWIQDNLRSEFMTPIWQVISKLGNVGFIWIVIAIILLFKKDTRQLGIMSIVALALSGIICSGILKNVVARPRPYEEIEGLVSVGGRPWDYSFPSGHTSAAFAIATIYMIKKRKYYGVIMTIFAFLIAFSRLYLGVHYFTDVFAGIIIGCLIGIIVVYIFDKCGYKNKK